LFKKKKILLTHNLFLL